MCFTRVSDRDSAGLALYSDDESDLIRELQTLCSSKSEPDISKVIQYSIQYKLLQVSILLHPLDRDLVLYCAFSVFSVASIRAKNVLRHKNFFLAQKLFTTRRRGLPQILQYQFKTWTHLHLQISVSHEDFIMLPGPSQDAHRRKVGHSYTELHVHASREDSSVDSTQPPVQQVTPAWLIQLAVFQITQ